MQRNKDLLKDNDKPYKDKKQGKDEKRNYGWEQLSR